MGKALVLKYSGTGPDRGRVRGERPLCAARAPPAVVWHPPLTANCQRLLGRALQPRDVGEAMGKAAASSEPVRLEMKGRRWRGG